MRSPSAPQAGCRGRSPRRGYRGSPPVSKNVGGWAGGTTAHAKPDPPLIEGAGHNETSVPPSRVQGRSPRRGFSESPAMLSEGLTCLSKEGAGNPMLRREVQGESPCL